MLRSRRVDGYSLSLNAAELLLEQGRVVGKQIRRGAGTEEETTPTHEPPDFQLALAFVNASDVIKLRAMVED